MGDHRIHLNLTVVADVPGQIYVFGIIRLDRPKAIGYSKGEGMARYGKDGKVKKTPKPKKPKKGK